MEKEDAPFSISEDDFLNLVRLAQQDDLGAILRLIDLFDQDIQTLSRYMSMPREDAVQSMKLELIQLIKTIKAPNNDQLFMTAHDKEGKL